MSFGKLQSTDNIFKEKAYLNLIQSANISIEHPEERSKSEMIVEKLIINQEKVEKFESKMLMALEQYRISTMRDERNRNIQPQIWKMPDARG